MTEKAMKPRYIITEKNKTFLAGETAISLTPDVYTEEELLKAINAEFDRLKINFEIRHIQC